MARQPFKQRIVFCPTEEQLLPFFPLGLFFPPHLPLCLFQFRFLAYGRKHIACSNGFCDFSPRSAGFPWVLAVDIRDDEGIGFVSMGVADFDFLCGFVFNGEGVCPLSDDGIEGFVVLVSATECGKEAASLAGEEAYAGVLDSRGEAGGGVDVSRPF